MLTPDWFRSLSKAALVSHRWTLWEDYSSIKTEKSWTTIKPKDTSAPTKTTHARIVALWNRSLWHDVTGQNVLPYKATCRYRANLLSGHDSGHVQSSTTDSEALCVRSVRGWMANDLSDRYSLNSKYDHGGMNRPGVGDFWRILQARTSGGGGRDGKHVSYLTACTNCACAMTVVLDATIWMLTKRSWIYTIYFTIIRRRRKRVDRLAGIDRNHFSGSGSGIFTCRNRNQNSQI